MESDFILDNLISNTGYQERRLSTIKEPLQRSGSELKDEDDKIDSHRHPKYLFWILAGAVLCLVSVTVAFGSIRFGDPLDASSPGQWSCAIMCSTIWATLGSGCTTSIVYEILIKRKIYCSLGLPHIPYLRWKFFFGVLLTCGSCLALWLGLYIAVGTMVPFHGFFAALFCLVVQSVYLWLGVVPTSYYSDQPGLRSIVFFGTIGLVFGGLLVPIMLYWLTLVLVQLSSSVNNIGVEVASLAIFQICKVFLMHFELYLVQQVMGEDLDGITSMLFISIISILHNSFYSVALESSRNYVAGADHTAADC